MTVEIGDPMNGEPASSVQDFKSDDESSRTGGEIGNDDEAESKAMLVTAQAGSDVGDQSNSDADDNQETQSQDRSRSYRFQAIRDICGRIVNNPHFQLFIVFLICVNAIMMGIATFSFVYDNPSIHDVFSTVDLVFLILFTIELGLQFGYYGVYLFVDGWLVFDFLIVLMSWSLESLQIVRTFRIFRALRLITRVKVLKNLVMALFSVAPKLNAIICLLLLVFYIYGVMCTVLFQNLYKDGVTDHDYFGRLDVSVWTLLVMMTLDWSNVSRQVMKVYPLSWMIFVSFVMVTSFIAYNLIIAVVCDSVQAIEHNDDKEAELIAEEEKRIGNTTRIRRLQKNIKSLTNQQNQVLSMLEEIVKSSKQTALEKTTTTSVPRYKDLDRVSATFKDDQNFGAES